MSLQSQELSIEDDDSFDGPIHGFRLEEICEMIVNECHASCQQNVLIPAEAGDYDDDDDNLELENEIHSSYIQDSYAREYASKAGHHKKHAFFLTQKIELTHLHLY